MRTKIFTLLLTLTICIQFLYAEKIGELNYQLKNSNRTAIVIRKSSTAGDGYTFSTVSIPATVTYDGLTYDVVEIGSGAFRWSSKLTSITIGGKITTIGDDAFNGCSSLASITIPSNVTSISTSAFTSCVKLETVTINSNNIASRSNMSNLFGGQVTKYIIGNNVTNIGYAAFAGHTNITSITIGNNVKTIEGNAFLNCTGLSSVTLPTSVDSVGNAAFAGCTGITSPIYNSKVFAYMPTNCSGAYAILTGIKSIAGSAFLNCSEITSITIPNSVNYIGESAFHGCGEITTVTMGNSVSYIGDNAFQNCHKVSSIIIPNTVSFIGENAFSGCDSLKVVTINSAAIISSNSSSVSFGGQVEKFVIGNNITEIGRDAFYNYQNLAEVVLPIGLTKIGSYAFYGCKNLNVLNLPSSLRDIGSSAFNRCSALRVVLPDSLVHIGKDAIYDTFTYNQNKNWINGVLYVNNYLIIGSSVQSRIYSVLDGTTLIADDAFSFSSTLFSVTLPQSVKYIGKRAFYNCSKMAHNVELPKYLEYVGDSAMYFKSINSFTYSLILPQTLSYIGKYTFYDEKAKINAIYAYMHTPPTLVPGAGTFSLENSMANTPVYVYADDVNTYLSAEVWKQFDVQAISAPIVTVNDSIVLDISSNMVTFSWQEISQASIYELAVLLPNGDTLELVKLNGQGEIKSSDRLRLKGSSAAAQGYQYTISGLENNMTYSYYLQAMNSTGDTLKRYFDSFITGQRYTVQFVDWDNSILKQEIVREGESATPPEDPEREGYTFTGWDKPYTNIHTNTTIKATYSTNTIYYTVTYLDWDGTELYVEQVEEGHDAVGPTEEPIREGYTFIGWSKPLTNIQSNLIVIAQYHMSEGIEDIETSNSHLHKILRDGNIYILRGEKVYTLQGQEVR